MRNHFSTAHFLYMDTCFFLKKPITPPYPHKSDNGTAYAATRGCEKMRNHFSTAHFLYMDTCFFLKKPITPPYPHKSDNGTAYAATIVLIFLL